MGKRSRRRVKPEKAERVPFRARTFEGLPGECDWVALREIVPAATASIDLRSDAGIGAPVQVCSLLPGGAAGLVRADGPIWLGLQVQHNFGDISRDLGSVIESGATLEPGSEIPVADPGPGRRLQDLVDPAGSFEVVVHDGFSFWTEGVDDPDGEIAASLEAANEAVAPTVRLSGIDAAYWTQMGERQFLRWVLPHDEDAVLDALARLRAANADKMGDATRMIGSFRAHGLLVPVWEMEGEVPPEALEAPAGELAERLGEALADSSDLSTEQRAARNGLANRQLTIR